MPSLRRPPTRMGQAVQGREWDGEAERELLPLSINCILGEGVI